MEVELYKKSAGALATLKSAPDQLTQATRNRDQDGAVDTYEDKRGQLDAQASKSVRTNAPAALGKQYEFSSGEEDSGGFQTRPVRDLSPPAPTKESPSRSMGARDLLAKQAAKQKPPTGYEPKQDWSSEEKATPWGEPEKPTSRNKEDPWGGEERPAPKSKPDHTPWYEEEKAPRRDLYPDLKPEKPAPKDYGYGVASEEHPQMAFRPEPATKQFPATKQPPSPEFEFSSSDESYDYEPKAQAQDWKTGALPQQRDTPGFIPPDAVFQDPSFPPQATKAPGQGYPQGQVKAYPQHPQQSGFPQMPPQAYASPQAFATMPPAAYPPNKAQAFPTVPPQSFPPGPGLPSNSVPGFPQMLAPGLPGNPAQGFPQPTTPAEYQAMMQMMQKQMFDYQNLLARQSDPDDPFRDADSGVGVVQAAARPQNNPFATGPPGRGSTSNTGVGDLI